MNGQELSCKPSGTLDAVQGRTQKGLGTYSGKRVRYDHAHVSKLKVQLKVYIERASVG